MKERLVLLIVVSEIFLYNLMVVCEKLLPNNINQTLSSNVPEITKKKGLYRKCRELSLVT